MNITIVGLGAIGSLWGYHLHQAEHNINVWTRKKSKTVSLRLNDKPTITLTNNNLNALQQADLIIVTVKAWQVYDALTPLLPHIHQESMIILMHNGMGAIQQLANIKQPLLLATTTHGAYRPQQTQVLHTGIGKTQLGGANSLGAKCDFLQPVLQHALPDVEWLDNIEQALWTKLAINCAINPLTALFDIRNGELAAPEYQTQLQAIINEVVLVMLAEKIINSDQVASQAKQLHNTVAMVIQATANNYSSMHQDIVHQRTTEIDFITGYVVDMAKKHHISVPQNKRLYQLISQQQARFTNV